MDCYHNYFFTEGFKLKKFVLLMMLIFTVSCLKDGSKSYDLEINFKLMANGELVDINTPSNHTNSIAQEYTVSKFQMLITDIAISQSEGASGTIVSNYHYYDVATSSTHKFSTKTDAKFNFLKFRFGATNANNTNDLLPNEEPYLSFLWNMGGIPGYHYMKFEGNEQPSNDSFAMHAGPTGSNDFSFEVTLPIQKSLEGNKLTLDVIIDVNEFFSNDFNFPISGIMMNATAQGHIKTNGPSVFSLE